MPVIDFLMTFPCYIPLRANGRPHTFNAEGDDAVAVFTDEDLLNRFFEQSPFGPESLRIRATIADSQSLSETLRKFDGCQSTSGRALSHVLIDPSGPRARTYSIAQFVAHLALDV